MCGIAGRINFNNSEQVRVKDIKTMTDAIEHRGPDDEGQWVEGNVGLGNRRLAIIDLSQNGHMPKFYARNRYVITFNGEIYNFKEERKKLIDKGYRFNSNSDTEVVLALYQEYGVGCLKHLRGMFAFAIWDRREKILFAARDRVGKKPFKYYLSEKCFIFASELKSILTQKNIQKKIDYQAIWDYLTYQYVPTPLTGFQNIKKLPAGHYLILKDRKIQIKKYWDLAYKPRYDLSEAEWKQKIIEELDESVRLRMISDVPLGAFLSGGVDSSSVVASMAIQSSSPIKTFSIGFKEASHNETQFARIVANRYHTDHTEFQVEPKAIELLPKLVKAFEEPFADSSAIPTYYVSQMTRQHVTVALNGDGGDENFGGYGWYQAMIASSYLQYIPFVIKKYLMLPSSLLLDAFLDTTFSHRGIRFAKSLLESKGVRYVSYLQYFSNEEKELLVTDSFKSKITNLESRSVQGNFVETAKAKDDLSRALYSDIRTYLADDLLVKVDIATMLNSLEGRSPLLDHKFMEMTAQIPSNLKIRNGEKKYIFKKALEDRLPKEVLYRKKMGFSVPMEHWLRGPLKKFVKSELMEGELVRLGLVHKKFVSEIINKHMTRNVDYSQRLWALLTLDYWLRIYKPQL